MFGSKTGYFDWPITEILTFVSSMHSNLLFSFDLFCFLFLQIFSFSDCKNAYSPNTINCHRKGRHVQLAQKIPSTLIFMLRLLSYLWLNYYMILMYFVIMFYLFFDEVDVFRVDGEFMNLLYISFLCSWKFYDLWEWMQQNRAGQNDLWHNWIKRIFGTF